MVEGMGRIVASTLLIVVLLTLAPVYAQAAQEDYYLGSLMYPWYKLYIKPDVEAEPPKLLIEISYPYYVDPAFPVAYEKLDAEYRLTARPPTCYGEECLGVYLSQTLVAKDYVPEPGLEYELMVEYNHERGGYVESRAVQGEDVLRHVRIDVGSIKQGSEACVEVGDVPVCGGYYVEGRATLSGEDFEDLDLGTLEEEFTKLVERELSFLVPVFFEAREIPELKNSMEIEVTHVERYSNEYIVEFIVETNPDFGIPPAYPVMKYSYREYTTEATDPNAPEPYIAVHEMTMVLNYTITPRILDWIHGVYEEWVEELLKIKEKRPTHGEYLEEYYYRVLPVESNLTAYLSALKVPVLYPEDPFFWLGIAEMVRHEHISEFTATISYEIENPKPIPWEEGMDGSEWITMIAKKAPRIETSIEATLYNVEDVYSFGDGILVTIIAFIGTLYGLPYDEAIADLDAYMAKYRSPSADWNKIPIRDVFVFGGQLVDVSYNYALVLELPLLNDNIRRWCKEHSEPMFEGANWSLATYKPEEHVCIIGKEVPDEAIYYADALYLQSYLYDIVNPAGAEKLYITTTPCCSTEMLLIKTLTETPTQSTPYTSTVLTQPSPIAESRRTPLELPKDLVSYGSLVSLVALGIALLVMIAKWRGGG